MAIIPVLKYHAGVYISSSSAITNPLTITELTILRPDISDENSQQNPVQSRHEKPL